MRTLITICVICLSILLAAGCGENPTDQSQQSAASNTSSTDPVTHASISVSIDRSEIDLTDPVVVHCTLTWHDDTTIELIEPDWDETEWTLSEKFEPTTIYNETNISDDQLPHYTQTIRYTIDPFLEGPYTIPSFGIRSQKTESPKRITRTSTLPVEVRAILEESDSDALDPLIDAPQTAQPLDESASTSTPLILSLVASFAAIAIIFALLSRHEDTDDNSELSPDAALLIATKVDEFDESTLSALHNALVALSKLHPVLNQHATQLESLRYSASSIDASSVRSLAHDALAISSGDPRC